MFSPYPCFFCRWWNDSSNYWCYMYHVACILLWHAQEMKIRSGIKSNEHIPFFFLSNKSRKKSRFPFYSFFSTLFTLDSVSIKQMHSCCMMMGYDHDSWYITLIFLCKVHRCTLILYPCNLKLHRDSPLS